MQAKPMVWISHVRATLFNHGEKIAAGLVAVLVLAALVDTNWIPFQRQPETLLQQIADARSRLDSGLWPAAERAKFEFSQSHQPDVLVDARLVSAIPLAAFTPSQRLVKRPGAADRILRQPILEPVQQLIGSSERLLVRLAPPVTTLPVDMPSDLGPPGSETDNSSVVPLDEFRSRRRAPPTMPATTGAIEATLTLQHAVVRGHGYPYASVRGVFDLRANARAVQNAVHCSYANALRLILILDFQLERQEFIRSPDHWSDWTPVDVQIFRDVAETADGFEPDVVSSQVTDSAITAPLLARITGVWRNQATHPRLAAFELSPEALERELAFLKALVSQVDQQQSSANTRMTEKRGFAPLIRDARQLQQQFLAGDSAGAPGTGRVPFGLGFSRWQNPQPANAPLETLIRDVARELDPRAQDQHLRDWIRARATAEGELLLFRYFDFDVKPGSTYRYRVRLELLNPNFGRSLAAAGGQADIVRTRSLLTPWSDATSPVHVADNVQYFLTRVEPGRQGRSPLARMNVFQYDVDLGATVRQEIDVALGQNIAGRTKAEQFDPARGTIGVADYRFHSDDVLVDVLPDLSFGAELHPDLALPANSRGAAQLVESALVVNRRHDLISLDRVSQAPELAAAQRALEWQSQLADQMVRKAQTIDETDSPLYDQYYQQLYDESSSTPESETERRAGPNVLQRARPR